MELDVVPDVISLETLFEEDELFEVVSDEEAELLELELSDDVSLEPEEVSLSLSVSTLPTCLVHFSGILLYLYQPSAFLGQASLAIKPVDSQYCFLTA